jgi:hypothetical protein
MTLKQKRSRQNNYFLEEKVWNSAQNLGLCFSEVRNIMSSNAKLCKEFQENVTYVKLQKSLK